jgi:hypothetical protein
MNRNVKYRRLTLALAMAGVILGFSCAPKVFAQGANSEVYPPGTASLGLSYGEWTASWWQWLLAIPTGPGSDQNPQDDATGQFCSTNQAGPVWFLAGSGSGQPVIRSCTIPSTASIFFPLVNIECSTQDPQPFHCNDAASCRRCAVTISSGIGPNTLNASLDGQPLLNGVQAFRAQSPFFSFTTPANNILGSNGGPGMSVSDGYWLMLKPLSPGKHTIKFGGGFVSGVGAGFTENVTYNITVPQ